MRTPSRGAQRAPRTPAGGVAHNNPAGVSSRAVITDVQADMADAQHAFTRLCVALSDLEHAGLVSGRRWQLIERHRRSASATLTDLSLLLDAIAASHAKGGAS